MSDIDTVVVGRWTWQLVDGVWWERNVVVPRWEAALVDEIVRLRTLVENLEAEVASARAAMP